MDAIQALKQQPCASRVMEWLHEQGVMVVGVEQSSAAGIVRLPIAAARMVLLGSDYKVGAFWRGDYEDPLYGTVAARPTARGVSAVGVVSEAKMYQAATANEDTMRIVNGIEVGRALFAGKEHGEITTPWADGWVGEEPPKAVLYMPTPSHMQSGVVQWVHMENLVPAAAVRVPMVPERVHVPRPEGYEEDVLSDSRDEPCVFKSVPWKTGQFVLGLNGRSKVERFGDAGPGFGAIYTNPLSLEQATKQTNGWIPLIWHMVVDGLVEMVEWMLKHPLSPEDYATWASAGTPSGEEHWKNDYLPHEITREGENGVRYLELGYGHGRLLARRQQDGTITHGPSSGLSHLSASVNDAKALEEMGLLKQVLPDGEISGEVWDKTKQSLLEACEQAKQEGLIEQAWLGSFGSAAVLYPSFTIWEDGTTVDREQLDADDDPDDMDEEDLPCFRAGLYETPKTLVVFNIQTNAIHQDREVLFFNEDGGKCWHPNAGMFSDGKPCWGHSPAQKHRSYGRLKATWAQGYLAFLRFIASYLRSDNIEDGYSPLVSKATLVFEGNSFGAAQAWLKQQQEVKNDRLSIRV